MKVTMKQISKRVGVSVNTVSLALRNRPGIKQETKDKIFSVAKELGYFENKQVVEVRNICLISTGERLRDAYFYMSFYQHILAEVYRYKYNMMVYRANDCDMEIEKLQNNFKLNSIVGVIILGETNEDIVEKVVACNIPVISIGTRYHKLKTTVLIEDNIEGSYKAVTYLIEKGYQNIGFIGRVFHSVAFMERYYGFIGAMKQNGLTYKESQNIIDIPKEKEYDVAVMIDRLKNMSTLPEAFLCANDNIAMLVAKALSALGFNIPKDIALIGFDNSSSGKLAIPAITSIDVQCELQAKVGVQTLMSYIEKKGKIYQIDKRVVLPVELKERESVLQKR